MKIVIVNTKGGASKSTVALQIASAYMLNKNVDFTHYEIDDENLDAESFTKTAIKTEQVQIDNGDGFNAKLRNIFTQNENHLVIDVGGNKTTTMFLQSISKSRMNRLVDLYIIPSSGGSQDILNMKKTYDLIKENDTNAKIIFALSRVRNIKRIQFQYANFFNMFENETYFTLQDSDVIDLSRSMQKTVYELVNDKKAKSELEKSFDKALNENDTKAIANISTVLEIFDEAENFYKKNILLAFETLDNLFVGENKNE